MEQDMGADVTNMAAEECPTKSLQRRRPDSPCPFYRNAGINGAPRGLSSPLNFFASCKREPTFAATPNKPTRTPPPQESDNPTCRTAKNLLIAVETGNVKSTRQILEDPANTTLLDDEFMDEVLIKAVRDDQVKTLPMLVEHGASVDATHATYGSPLHTAVGCNAKKCLLWLLDHDAPINTKDGSQLTPLDLAVKCRSDDVVRMLIQSGANFSAPRGDAGQTTLHIAAAERKDPCIQLLLDLGMDVNAKDQTGRTPLHLAAQADYAIPIRLLLKYGANINARDNENDTPLLLAVRGANRAAAHALLRDGVDVDADSRAAETPLQLAIRNGMFQTVTTLLALGSTIDARALCETAAAKAECTFSGKIDLENYDQLLGELLEKSPEAITSRHPDGYTALHLAVGAGDVELVQTLIKAGADVNARDAKGGSTALHDACRKADRRDNMAILEELLNSGADVDSKDEAGATPLHIAAAEGDVEIVRVLLQANTDVDLQGKDGGNTALHDISKNTNPCAGKEIMLDLLSAGAHIDAQDDEGCTPLHLATRYVAKDSIPILLRAGADPNLADKQGVTPQQLAFGKESGRILSR